MSTSHDPETLTQLKQIDELCLRFEDAWRVGSPLPLETYLDSAGSASRGELLGELLLVEWSYRFEAGDSFFQGEYAQRFADHVPDVTAAWERWKDRDNSLYATIGPSADTQPAPMPPSPWLPVVPGCEKVEPIGEGGMGEVFRAYDTNLRRHVAVKRVRLERESPDRLRRFRTEAEALARLGHPHIVTAHAYHDDAGRPLLVMEYVANGSLTSHLGTFPCRLPRRPAWWPSWPGPSRQPIRPASSTATSSRTTS